MDANDDRVREGLTTAVAEAGAGGASADRLCAACVQLLDVEGASLSIVSKGVFFSIGVGGPVAGEMDQLRLTLGEGPCIDAVNSSIPVLVADLNGPDTQRWPAFAGAAVCLGVRAVFAFPVAVAGFPVGVLALYRGQPGRLAGPALTGGYLGAELAVLPLLDVLGIDMQAAVNDVGSPAWDELGSMMRAEVYQATGVLIAQLGVAPAEAMVRLRAHAFANGMTVSNVAYQILEHNLYLHDDAAGNGPGKERF